MKIEFCTHEQTLALKELGFEFNDDYYEMAVPKPLFYEIEYFETPLIQQAFRFFREKYGLNAYFMSNDSSFWCYNIDRFPYNYDNGDIDKTDYNWLTYEEAQQSCLYRLIELAKEDKQ